MISLALVRYEMIIIISQRGATCGSKTNVQSDACSSIACRNNLYDSACFELYVTYQTCSAGQWTVQASKFKSVYLIWNVKEISSWPIELLKGTSIRFFSWLLSLAVAYECTRTITSIYPDKDLIDKAARCVGVFLVAKSNDIKYLGRWFKCFLFLFLFLFFSYYPSFTWIFTWIL